MSQNQPRSPTSQTQIQPHSPQFEDHHIDNIPLPDADGYFGIYGGAILPPELKEAMDDIAVAYDTIKKTAEFQAELQDLFINYVGRPSPLYFAKNLTKKLGGAQIYLKREDLNMTGAHKINHCLGQSLLAKYMGKTKIIVETGAGQHGLASATAAALVGIPCEVYMGEIDAAKQMPNVMKMKLLGAKVIRVTRGGQALKDAVDAAFEEYLTDPKNFFYGIGSVVGPNPFPAMVRDFQSIIGNEIYTQSQNILQSNPDIICASVGGGSNALGCFSRFLNEKDVKLIGIEPAGRGLDTPDHAATLTLGKPSVIHGMYTYVLETPTGEAHPVHSIASGLDYPGVGPQHSYLKDIKRVQYESVTDQECLDAYMMLSRIEGIIPALESAHAVAYVIREAPKLDKNINIVVNLSGRGDKDADFVLQKLGIE
jgi:tryptophan synthase beta chain